MTGSRLQWLALALGACSAGFALAGSGDITKRDPGGGSVELTNLGEEDAPVVVAVPARTAAAQAIPVAAERPSSVRPSAQREKRLRDKDEEELADDEQASGTREQRAEQSAGSGRGDWDRSDSIAASSGFTSNNGYGAPTYGGSTGNTGNTGGSTPDGGGTSAPPATTPATLPPAAPATTPETPPPAALDSPQRWEDYRWRQLNEPRGSNGLVANPAVQRRYLKTTRGF